MMKLANSFVNLKTSSIFACVILIITLLSCGPKLKTGPGAAAKPNTPFNLKAVAASKAASLTWQIERGKSSHISGYNIYLATSPDSDGELYNSAPFPGDTDDDLNHETFDIPRLDNGQRYFAYVRTVFSDGTMSPPTGRVSFLPLAQGEITLSRNYSKEGSGFSFAKEKYTPARDFDNDIYLFATKDKSGISSPSRLHSSLRKSEISIDGGVYEQTQPLRKGKTYIVKTSDGGHAKITLTKITGMTPEIEASFKYIYYPPGLEPK